MVEGVRGSARARGYEVEGFPHDDVQSDSEVFGNDAKREENTTGEEGHDDDEGGPSLYWYVMHDLHPEGVESEGKC